MSPLLAREQSILAAVAVLGSILLSNIPTYVDGAPIPRHHEEQRPLLTHGSRCVVLRDALPDGEFGSQYTLALGSCGSKDAVEFKYNEAEHQLVSNIDGLCLSTLEPDNHAVGLASCNTKKHCGDPEGKKWEVMPGGAWRNYNCLCLHYNGTMLVQDNCDTKCGEALSSGFQWELLPKNPRESSKSGCASTAIAVSPDMPQQTPHTHVPAKPEEDKEPSEKPEKVKEPSEKPEKVKEPSEKPEKVKEPSEKPEEVKDPEPEEPMATPTATPYARPILTPHLPEPEKPEEPEEPMATPTATPYARPILTPQLPEPEKPEEPMATPYARPILTPQLPEQEKPEEPEAKPTATPHARPIVTPHLPEPEVPQATHHRVPQATPTATPYAWPKAPQQAPCA